MKSNPKTSSEFENFREFVRKVINVPGAHVRRQIEQEKEMRAKKKRAKNSPASRVSRAKD
jgi:hypothetical protein